MAELIPDLSPRLARPLRLVAVGDELLRGDRTDTNSPWLAARLTAIGWIPDTIEQVGDSQGAAAAAVTRWLAEGGCLILGGGLGPTVDDRTREEVAAGLGVALRVDERAAAWIREREARLARHFGPQTHGQARLPEGCEPLYNAQGTAPGFWRPHAASSAAGFLVVLPGVPGECRAFGEGLFPPKPGTATARFWLLAGLGEDKLAGLVADFPGRERLGFYPSFEGLRLRVPAAGVDEIGLSRRLADYLVSHGDETLESVVIRLLKQRGQSLAVAESCTGGLLGGRLSRVPGASEVWLGGVLSYADAVKVELLGVPAALIAEQGAVSRAVAEAMAAGARRRLGSDWALAITGIAGPGGARPGKPVGTLHIALAGPQPQDLRQLALRAGWDRENNRRFAVHQALTLLWSALKGEA